MAAFEWLGQLIEALGKFIPRLLIVRTTHGGVKYVMGRKVKALKPGLHIYWPITTDTELIVTARQCLNLPPQTVTTKDRVKLVVSAVAVYSINDVVQAIGHMNWDVDGTVGDITQAAVMEVITSMNFDTVTAEVVGSVEQRLTKTAAKRLRRYGVRVHRCALTDLAQCNVIRLIQNDKTV